MTYRHILVAIDLSDESGQVLDRAAAVAKLTGARVSVVSVVRPLAQVYGGLDLTPLAMAGIGFEQAALDQATVQARTLASRYGVDPECVHVFVGAPAEDVRALAERLGADLIVMGTHGRHGLGRLLGSTANAVLHGVGCDVLAVRMKFGQ